MEKIQATEIELNTTDGSVYVFCQWETANKMLQSLSGRCRFVVTFADGFSHEGHCAAGRDVRIENVIRTQMAVAEFDSDLTPQAVKFLETHEIPG